MTLPEITLDRDQLASFCELKASWSPDGQYLAVPRPGPTAALLIVLPEQGRVLKTLDRASLPSWSPESSRMTFIRTSRDGSSTQTLQVIGRDFGAGRSLAELSDMSEPACWSQDGQSVLVAARRVRVRPQNFELIRVFIDSGVAVRAMVLSDEDPLRDASRDLSPRRNLFPPENAAKALLMPGLDAPPQGATQRISLGFDRGQEQCAFSTDLEGRIPVIGYNDLRDIRRPGVVLKKFHPLDISLRIGSLALHPDDQLVAARIDTLGGASPPLLCDLGSMSVKLIAADSCAHLEWLTTLVATAQGLLETVPQPSLDGQPVERVSLLPARGELLEQNPALIRLHRIGKVARTLLDEPGDQSSAVADAAFGQLHDECRLFFDYLRGNYKDAETDLDVLAARAATSDQRFRLLALRAQVLQAQALTQQARAVIDYLLKVQGGPPCRIEETSVGMVLTPANDPGQLWTRYLAQHLSDNSPALKSSPGDIPGENEEAIDLRMPVGTNGGFFIVPRDDLDGRLIDGGVRFPRRGPGPGGFGPGIAPRPGGLRMGGGPFGPGLQRPERLFPPQPPLPAQPGGPFPRRFRRFNRPDQGPGE